MWVSKPLLEKGPQRPVVRAVHREERRGHVDRQIGSGQVSHSSGIRCVEIPRGCSARPAGLPYCGVQAEVRLGAAHCRKSGNYGSYEDILLKH